MSAVAHHWGNTIDEHTAAIKATEAAALASSRTRALLKLLHLGSPMLPVGAFSYSQGLEWAVEAGTIVDRSGAETWIFDVLRWSLGRFEAPLLIAAHRRWTAIDDAQVDELNRWMLATRETRELRAETEQLGYSLRRWCRDSAAVDASTLARLDAIDTPTWPVTFAAVASSWAIGSHDMLSTYLWTWVENQVGAALKAVPLGQTDGQKILLAAPAVIDSVAIAAVTLASGHPREWPTQCPGLAIASSRHETQYSRLFRS